MEINKVILFSLGVIDSNYTMIAKDCIFYLQNQKISILDKDKNIIGVIKNIKVEKDKLVGEL